MPTNIGCIRLPELGREVESGPDLWLAERSGTGGTAGAFRATALTFVEAWRPVPELARSPWLPRTRLLLRCQSFFISDRDRRLGGRIVG